MVNSPEGDYVTSCLKCGASGKGKVTINREEYEELKQKVRSKENESN
jgi:hypothetical protein